jgi:NAD-dependent SIR2 family protein deacetylase
MSDIVFILGAGASRHAGAPLMAEFLDKARDLRAANPSSECHDDLDRVFEAISRLTLAHSKSELDIVNLESVFGAFEMAELLKLSDYSGVVASLKRVISWTLNESMAFMPALMSSIAAPSAAYDDFAKLLVTLRTKTPLRTAAIITFNYDIGLDYALAVNRLRPSYYLEGPDAGQVPLLKLHGSVSWGQCLECGCAVATSANPTIMATQPVPSYKFKMPRQQHCQKWVECLIVPPSWNKSEGRQGLVSVWQQAAKELATASTIAVCGYSLPETDSFFRYLYALGSVGSTVLRNFWVFDPSTEVHERFKNLLGPGAYGRFQPRPHLFENAISVMRALLLES